MHIDSMKHQNHSDWLYPCASASNDSRHEVMENRYVCVTVCDEDLLDLCSTLFALLSFDVDVVYVQLQ